MTDAPESSGLPGQERAPATDRSPGSGEAPASAPSAPARNLADGTERPLDPRDIALSRITSGIGAGVLAVLALIGSGVLLGIGPMPPPLNGLVAAALGAIVLLRFTAAWFWPPVRHRHASWRLDGEGLRIRRGVLWRSEILVPRSRVQHTDVSRGPLERSFGLATLVVYTAGTEHSRVTLHGLAEEDAFAARDCLLEDAGGPGR